MRIHKNLLLTPQESKIIGSSIRDKHNDRFYTPLAVQDGADIREINDERMKQNIFYGYCYYFVGEDMKEPISDTGLAAVIFAPLNLQTGETLFDPRPLDSRLRLKPDGLRLRLDYLFV